MYNAKYVKPENASDPLVSPVYDSDEHLEKFPPMLIISADEDRLCEENEEFALKPARAGVTVTLRQFIESIHSFVINRMCEWQQVTDLSDINCTDKGYRSGRWKVKFRINRLGAMGWLWLEFVLAL